MSQQIRDQLQATLGNAYTLERELGGGGMSRVFVAEETALRRKVVVKVLPPELTAGVNVERFNREILLAAKLQHPHIVPVLAAGETQGLPYYTMPLVEGESLRARLARGPLTVTDAVSILRDVARALAYAHERGIVHRDIKPDNVLITGGSATVTDFGIAKAISASRTGGGNAATLTQLGTSIGTPTYMSPEQAAGDPDTNQRTDIYSFGCMAYELLAGRPPFVEQTPRKLLAAHMGEAPAAIAGLRPDIPPMLAELVMRCLAKEADDRPQAATDLVRVLETVTSSGGGAAMPSVLLGGPGMFRKALAIYAGAFVVVAIVAKAAIVGIGLPDWVFPGSLIVMALGLPVVLWTGYVHRVARRAMTMTPTFTPGGTPAMAQGTIATMALKAAPRMSWYKTARGGMYAFGAFIAMVAIFMAMRAFGIGPFGSLIGKGAFGDRETIVVADFTSPKDDPSLGATASEALRTDLAQSSSLKVLTKAAVAEVLRLMQRPADGEVKFSLAREVASREGAKAVLDGDISKLGGTYVIAARLVGALDGAELATFRETARGQDELVTALGALSKDIRSKVGESLKNVHESIPLERVTTASLPALRKYVEGVQVISTTGDAARGRVLLEEAVALDSTFAMAWRRIAASYTGTFAQEGLAQAATAKAFKYRDHLSETERLLTEALYYSYGAGHDRERAISAYETLIDRDSTNRSALNNVAIEYCTKRDFPKCESLYRRAVAVDQPFGGSFVGLIFVQLAQGKVAAADTSLAMFEKRLPAHGLIGVMRGVLAVAHGRLADADTTLRGALARTRDAEVRNDALNALASMATMRGRVRDGQRWTAQNIPDSASVPAATVALARLGVILDSAWVQAFYLRDATAARATVQRAFRKVPIESIAPPDRPWTAVLAIAAVTRDAAGARAAYASLERDKATSSAMMIRGFLASNRGLAALAEGRAKEAAADFAEADKGDLGPQQIGPWRAYALDQAGEPDSAIAEFERYVALPDPTRVNARDHLAPAQQRLGELYEARGNVEKAVDHYRAFLDLWKNADPELQPQVAAVRARLSKLAPVEGPTPKAQRPR